MIYNHGLLLFSKKIQKELMEDDKKDEGKKDKDDKKEDKDYNQKKKM